jgi:hypothetical protein
MVVEVFFLVWCCFCAEKNVIYHKNDVDAADVDVTRLKSRRLVFALALTVRNGSTVCVFVETNAFF